MSTVTGSLTVNAAFLREIKEDNHRVHYLFEEAQKLLSFAPLGEFPPRRLVDTLSELRDQLALHFSLEEAYGYFEDALQVAPRLSDQASELRGQHAQLFVAVCQLVEEAEKWLYREASRDLLPMLVERFGKFHDEFRRHESREADLIQEAFERDVGVGD